MGKTAMTAGQFKEAIEKLGLTLSGAAVLLDVHPRTIRRWANRERAIPGPVHKFLQHLMDARAKSAKATRAPKARKTNGKIKARGVGPTFTAEFADGVTTRMSVFTAPEKLDWARGERLAQMAWQSRWRAQYHKRNGRAALIDTVAPVPPAIVSARFEQDGKMLGTRP